MIRFISLAILFQWLTLALPAQPGYSLAPLKFKVYYQGQIFTGRPEKDIVMEWCHGASGGWQKCLVQNGLFVTGSIDVHRSPALIKIYRLNEWDTMFITTSHSLYNIPFQAGHFIFDRHSAPLACIKSLAGVQIINQHWKYFSKTAIDTLPILQIQRYVYIDKDLYPHEDYNEYEPGVVYKGFTKSEHIRGTDEGYEVFMELGQLYYAPAISSSVFCIGYLNDLDKQEKDYRPYLLESKDGCRSWAIRFAMQEGDDQLANITDRGFVFYREDETVNYVTCNTAGQLIDSLQIEEPCSFNYNIFSSCDADTKFSNIQGIESSSPFMDNSNMQHLFHRHFTNDGVHFIGIDDLPFQPNEIKRWIKNGLPEKILELNTGDTYAYLTLRKNKLVLLSYDFTMVSKNFGNTWIYYRNGLISGGEWNFIWLDDNTLVNVTQKFADVMQIE